MDVAESRLRRWPRPEPRMNYIGSKTALLPLIARAACGPAVAPHRRGAAPVFADAYAGSGVVSRHFKALGHRVLSNDLQSYAAVTACASLESDAQPDFERLHAALGPELRRHRRLWPDPTRDVLSLLNALPGEDGFVASTYAPRAGRRYFTDENARRIDGVRSTLRAWRASAYLSEYEHAYLLASLIEAADRVANVASVYDAYLKAFKPSALAPLRLAPIRLTPGPPGCRAFHGDAEAFVRAVDADVLYLDPPYSTRAYARCYHVLETIALGDHPTVRGVTGMRESAPSAFSQPQRVEGALRALLAAARAPVVVVSYSDEGLVSPESLHALLEEFGRVDVATSEHRRFRADSARVYKRRTTTEYVYALRPELRAAAKPTTTATSGGELRCGGRASFEQQEPGRPPQRLRVGETPGRRRGGATGSSVVVGRDFHESGT